MAGLPLFAATFRVVDMGIGIELHADGERVQEGDEVDTVTGQPGR